MKLSAIILVRDCEKILPKCLESLRGIDEIICVVDTRSQNKEQLFNMCYYHPKVKAFYYEWASGSFADARNYGIDKASSDWLLTIDSDESVPEGGIDKIKELISQPFDVWEVLQIDKNGQMCKTFRLFRKGITYTNHSNNKIHETLDIKETHSIGYSDVVINHHKSLTPEEHEAKMLWIMENLEGIEQSVKKDYYQGIYYIHTGEHKRGFECLNNCLDKVPPSLKAFIYLAIGKHYSRISDLYEIEAVHFILKSIEEMPEQNEGYVTMANYYIHKKEYDKAIKCLNNLAGLKTKMQNDVYYTEEQITNKLMEIN